jgi:hypothetical protein
MFMNKRLIILLCAVLLGVVSNIDSNRGQFSHDELSGTWINRNQGITFTFYDNGVLSFSTPTLKNGGYNYRVSGHNLTLSAYDGNMTFSYQIVNNNTLMLTKNSTNNSRSLILEKAS